MSEKNYSLEHISLGLSVFIGRMMTISGNCIMFMSVSTGIIIIISSLGLYIALPALKREILFSNYAVDVTNSIKQDQNSSHDLCQKFNIHPNDDLYNDIIFLSDDRLSISELNDTITDLIKRPADSSSQILVIANDLESTVDNSYPILNNINQECKLEQLQ